MLFRSGVRGAPAWSPDGKWIAVAADEGEGGRLFKVPLDGGPPIRIVDELALNPVWSPDGRLIVYSGPSVGGQALLKAVTMEKQLFPLPDLRVLGEGNRYRFLPRRNALVVMQGPARSQNFWLLDLSTGRLRRLTNLRPGSLVKGFDVSPDGKQIVFDRLRENSYIVLIDR